MLIKHIPKRKEILTQRGFSSFNDGSLITRHRQRRQNTDDRDHDQQFDQREAVRRFSSGPTNLDTSFHRAQYPGSESVRHKYLRHTNSRDWVHPCNNEKANPLSPSWDRAGESGDSAGLSCPGSSLLDPSSECPAAYPAILDTHKCW